MMLLFDSLSVCVDRLPLAWVPLFYNKLFRLYEGMQLNSIETLDKNKNKF